VLNYKSIITYSYLLIDLDWVGG